MSAEGTAEDTAEDTAAEAPRPMLRIVRGDPTPEEIAALTVVVAAASGGGPEPERGPHSVWADRSRLVRGPVRAGPNGWRASALPG